VPRLQGPVFILLAEFELTSRSGIAREWFTTRDAPHKELFVITQAGHGAAFEGKSSFARFSWSGFCPRRTIGYRYAGDVPVSRDQMIGSAFDPESTSTTFRPA